MPLSPSWAAINFTNFSVCDKKNEFEEVVNVTGVKLWISLHPTDCDDTFYGKQQFVTVITNSLQLDISFKLS